MADLFSNLTVGAMTLGHRVAMAPLTRMRAVAPAYAPADMMVEYYSQRASKGGLIITEATHVSQAARGAPDTQTDRDFSAELGVTARPPAAPRTRHRLAISNPPYRPKRDWRTALALQRVRAARMTYKNPPRFVRNTHEGHA